MSMPIKQLIKVLQTKDPKAEVEFVVVKIDGKLIAMDIENKANSMVKMLELFKK